MLRRAPARYRTAGRRKCRAPAHNTRNPGATIAPAARLQSSPPLARSVTVAHQVLVLSVEVRILAGQIIISMHELAGRSLVSSSQATAALLPFRRSTDSCAEAAQSIMYEPRLRSARAPRAAAMARGEDRPVLVPIPTARPMPTTARLCSAAPDGRPWPARAARPCSPTRARWARDRFCGRRSGIAPAHDVARPFSPVLAIGAESPHYENAKLQGTGKMPVLRKPRRLVVARASSPVPNEAPPRPSCLTPTNAETVTRRAHGARRRGLCMMKSHERGRRHVRPAAPSAGGG